MFVPPIYSDSKLLDPGAQHTPGAPVICSEYGGVNIIPAKGSLAGDRDWGYTTASDPEDLLSRLEKLAMAVVKGGHSCGMVYTQLYVFFLLFTIACRTIWADRICGLHDWVVWPAIKLLTVKTGVISSKKSMVCTRMIARRKSRQLGSKPSWTLPRNTITITLAQKEK